MSRSFRKAVIKDKGKSNSSYNKTVRRVNKSIVKKFKTDYKEIVSETFDLSNKTEGLEDKIKHPKEIINSYDISDYKTNFEAFTSKELEKYDLIQDKIKYRRK